jgi:hypothetical protein
MARNTRRADDPLSERERDLILRLFRWEEMPPAFKTAVTEYASLNGSLHVSSMPSLKGEEWRTVSAFGTNWGNYGGSEQVARYYKDVLGMVHVEGLLTKNGTPATGDTLFTLAAGYRPANSIRFPVYTSDGTTFTAGLVRVEADGDIVWLSGNTAEVDETDLSSIHFRAA